MGPIRYKIKVLVAVGTIALCLLVVAMLGPRSNFGLADDSTDGSLSSKFSWGTKPSTETKPTSKLAFFTFLSTRVGDDEDDTYFNSARVLGYQLMHAPETRSQEDIDYVVMVTKRVSQRKRDRLTKDGARVVVVEDIPKPSLSSDFPGFIDQYTKFRAWTFTEYERIVFIDADIFIAKPLDGIFNSSFAMPKERLHVVPDLEDEAPLPENYLFAGISDSFDWDHAVPTPDIDKFNAGFFVMKPDMKIFEYYMSVMKTPDKYDYHWMEQGLLNFVHREDGNLPWARLEASRWNANLPSMKDYNYGTASLHQKFYDRGDIELQRMWWRVRGQMEGFWAGIEEGNKRRS